METLKLIDTKTTPQKRLFTTTSVKKKINSMEMGATRKHASYPHCKFRVFALHQSIHCISQDVCPRWYCHLNSTNHSSPLLINDDNQCKVWKEWKSYPSSSNAKEKDIAMTVLNKQKSLTFYWENKVIHVSYVKYVSVVQIIHNQAFVLHELEQKSLDYLYDSTKPTTQFSICRLASNLE